MPEESSVLKASVSSDSIAADIGRDFERFRGYLMLLARGQLQDRLRGKLDASDIAQQTLMEAHVNCGDFRGATDGEKAAWLRQILARNIADVHKEFARGKRDAAREHSLQATLAESSQRLANWLAADQSSPSEAVRREERAVRVAAALNRLPSTRREAVTLRHWDGLSIAEIGRRLNVSADAVTGLLYRGLRNLKADLRELEELP